MVISVNRDQGACYPTCTRSNRMVVNLSSKREFSRYFKWIDYIMDNFLWSSSVYLNRAALPDNLRLSSGLKLKSDETIKLEF